MAGGPQQEGEPSGCTARGRRPFPERPPAPSGTSSPSRKPATKHAAHAQRKAKAQALSYQHMLHTPGGRPKQESPSTRGSLAPPGPPLALPVRQRAEHALVCLRNTRANSAHRPAHPSPPIPPPTPNPQHTQTHSPAQPFTPCALRHRAADGRGSSRVRCSPATLSRYGRPGRPERSPPP
jgi:hypothetical protein